jgi:hypothetical protein
MPLITELEPEEHLPRSTRGARECIEVEEVEAMPDTTPVQHYTPAIERFIMNNVINHPQEMGDVTYDDAHERFGIAQTSSSNGYSEADMKAYRASKASLAKHRMRRRSDVNEYLPESTADSASLIELKKLELQAHSEESMRAFTLAMEDLKIRDKEVTLKRDILEETRKENQLVLIRGLVEKGCSQEEIEEFLRDDNTI